MNGLTVKQISEQINQNKQKTYRLLKKLGIEPFCQDKNRILYSSDAVETLTKYLKEEHQNTENAPKRQDNTRVLLDYIETLKAELSEKNGVIAAQMEQIKELTITVNSLSDAVKMNQANQLTEKQLLLQEDKRKPFWIFKRK